MYGVLGEVFSGHQFPIQLGGDYKTPRVVSGKGLIITSWVGVSAEKATLMLGQTCLVASTYHSPVYLAIEPHGSLYDCGR